MAHHIRLRTALLFSTLFGLAVGCSGLDDGADRRAAPPPAGARRGFTLLATGDLLIHASVIRQARADAGGEGYDFRRMLAGDRDLVSRADLALCHMETITGRKDGPFSGYPAFKSPPQVSAAARSLGYDSCSTASNHTLDDGPEGVGRTLAAMDGAGLAHAGSARSAAEGRAVTMLRAGGAKVAQLAYTYGTNGIPVPDGKRWLVNLIDPARIVEDARAARRAGAEVVVVSLHWGTEWQQAPDDLQRSVARELTASTAGGRKDIDLIIGTHAHIPQAYEKVNGTWVVYGLGDQIAGVMPDPRGQMGSAARFTFAPPTAAGRSWTVARAEYIPQIVANDPIGVVNLPRALREDPDNARYREALRTIKDAVLSRGAAKDGLIMGG
ncbi:CapA family protein [Streptomyces palmae]|uniref:CapA family protein n=1 Tax=Streptomyces palmae TaxID=1701085 RepID=A0A4Z0HEQ2_9ACTN|nr:CapA family protein [Streptomyces palmae]TGB18060.1 CapA family protein [Streptomyces palmae]